MAGITHGPFSYGRLRPLVSRREASRATFGFDKEAVVMLVFGSLRFWQEVNLVVKGYEA
ncbi:MAG: hypothetical protein HOI95_03105 [Chromatiales bacterium]|nr:hypothetical protein [Chromatiales bacterium]